MTGPAIGVTPYLFELRPTIRTDRAALPALTASDGVVSIKIIMACDATCGVSPGAPRTDHGHHSRGSGDPHDQGIARIAR